LQEFVYERGLAMIDVGDNGDVAKLFDHWERIELGGLGKIRAL
ncbi:MAG: hypothetical protein RLZZ627_328, partial [Pseudomonadota bacterium]